VVKGAVFGAVVFEVVKFAGAKYVELPGPDQLIWGGDQARTVAEKERVNVPQWAGIGAIVAGVVLLVVGGRK